MSVLKNLDNLKFIKSWLFSCICLITLMIIVGGLTRLTGSGLSITEWELFKGIFPPLNKSQWNDYFALYKNIPQYYLINSNITLDEFKVIFYWEYAHRILGRIIGLFFIIPLIFLTFKKKIFGVNLFNLYSIFILICIQGFIGWYMVQSGLTQKVTVSHYRLAVHLSVAFIIMSMMYWNFLNIIYRKEISFLDNFSLNNINYLFFFSLFIQIILGAFVSGLDAGNIYQTWPLMNSTYFPSDVDIDQISDLFNFDNHSLVQFFHRNFAYLIFFLFLILGYIMLKKNNLIIKKQFFIVSFFILAQIFLGILTLLSNLNLYIALLHQLTSIFLVLTTLNLNYKFITIYGVKTSNFN